jgi:2-methylcitrate dehydratase PrpD
MQFAEEGAETKRLHPGWAASAGITAAMLACHGVSSPQQPFEGGQGLYRAYCGPGESADLAALVDALGEQWQIDDVAVKLHPTCHFTHSFIEAAVEVAHEHDIDPRAVDRITCPIHDDEVPVVCEPRRRKVAPGSDYEAKFSLQYTVAASLVHRQLTLAELDPSVRADALVLDLAGRVDYCSDPASDYPAAYSGEVVVHMTDGRELRRRVQVNRGSQRRPVDEAAIVEKFRANLRFAAVTEPIGERILDAVMTLEACPDVSVLAEMLALGGRR